MKRKLILSITLILTISTLCGCHNTSTIINGEYNTTEQKIDLSDYNMEGQDGFIGLDKLASISGMVYQQCCFYDEDSIMVLYTDENITRVQVNVISLVTGQSTEYASWELDSEGCDGTFTIVNTEPLVVMDNCMYNYYVYDDSKEEVKSINRVNRNYQASIYSNQHIYSIENGDIVSISCLDNSEEVVYDNTDNPEIVLNMLKSMADDNTRIIASGFDAEKQKDSLFVIDLKRREIVKQIDGDFFYTESDDYIYSYKADDSIVIVNQRSKDDNKQVTTYEYSAIVYANYFKVQDDTLILEETDSDKMCLKCCNLTSGAVEHISTFNTKEYAEKKHITSDKYIYNAMNDKNALSSDKSKFIFILYSNECKEDIVIWNVEAGAISSENLSSKQFIDNTDYTFVEDANLTYWNKIKDIYSKFGVRVFCGKTINTDFPDYSVDRMNDEATINTALDTLYKIFNSYPKGFFEYLLSDGYLSGMSVFLTGHIYPASSTAIDNAAGFAVVNHDIETIVVDIESLDSFESDMYHEISHAIYDRILFQESKDNTTYFDMTSWNLLNPPDFNYYESYIDSNGRGYDMSSDITYTGKGYFNDWNLNNVYFIDSYAKTFLTEDLARLMEYDMTYGTSLDYMNSPHIKAKLDYYYRAIRAAWDSDKWPAQTNWEQ